VTQINFLGIIKMKCALPNPLRGIIVPLVTPLLEGDLLDVEGLERLVEHVITGGVQGIFVLGTTGEAPSLSYKLRFDLVTRVCKQAAGRVPVLVGITDTSFFESINMAEHSAKAGSAAVVLAPPYYYPTSQPELLEYLAHIMPRLPLPLFLYNMPGMTKVHMTPDTVVAASKMEGIIGLKDSSGNLTYFKNVLTLLKDRNDFSMLTGPEELLAETILAGGHGGVNGGANLFPRLYSQLYKAAVAKDIKEIAVLNKQLMEISTYLYNVGRYGSSYLKGLKCALSCVNLCSDFLAEPFHCFRQQEYNKVMQLLSGWQELIEAHGLKLQDGSVCNDRK
jgi:dihydrodipicolinate synthase/N-acetylneuraminate lyase